MKNMARKELPLCVLPTGARVYESDLDVRVGERVRMLLGWLVAGLFVLLVCLAGSAQ